ncbi:hypothetical protein TNCV_1899361 [Trichonephila clavipes]|nr:hypothetical protein TNCV_1899361 [Trichonephila clavipes]
MFSISNCYGGPGVIDLRNSSQIPQQFEGQRFEEIEKRKRKERVVVLTIKNRSGRQSKSGEEGNCAGFPSGTIAGERLGTTFSTEDQPASAALDPVYLAGHRTR